MTLLRFSSLRSLAPLTVAALGALAALAACSSEDAATPTGCTKDTDCATGRVCDAGTCVNQSTTASGNGGAGGNASTPASVGSGMMGATCGDGVVEAGEACDDGNTSGGDACTADCKEVADTPVEIDCGQDQSCCVRMEKSGSLKCWGDFAKNLGTLSGPFTSFSVNSFGSNAYVVASNPTTGTTVYAGPPSPECSQQLIPNPAQGFASVTAGTWGACGIRPDSTMSCWGGTCGAGCNNAGQYVAQSGTWKTLGNGNPASHNCALSTSGQVSCWGCNDVGQLNVPSNVTKWKTVGTNNSDSYGLDANGTAHRWGILPLPAIDAADNLGFERLECRHGPGNASACCGMKTDGAAKCWGNAPPADMTPPAGLRFLDVAMAYVGPALTCGITKGHRVVCWGQEQGNLIAGAPKDALVCEPDAATCLGALAGTCNAEGTGLVSVTDCAASGKSCAVGACSSG